MDLLRHGAMDRVFAGVRAPSTLGTFLRCFTHGHVRQLESVARGLLPGLFMQAGLLGDADAVTFLDIDDTVKATYRYAKEGAGFGYSGIKGLNALLATASTPTAAPVIVGTRLRKGTTTSARGAASLLSESLGAAREAGLETVRAQLIGVPARLAHSARRLTLHLSTWTPPTRSCPPTGSTSGSTSATAGGNTARTSTTAGSSTSIDQPVPPGRSPAPLRAVVGGDDGASSLRAVRRAG